MERFGGAVPHSELFAGSQIISGVLVQEGMAPATNQQEHGLDIRVLLVVDVLERRGVLVATDSPVRIARLAAARQWLDVGRKLGTASEAEARHSGDFDCVECH